MVLRTPAGGTLFANGGAGGLGDVTVGDSGVVSATAAGEGGKAALIGNGGTGGNVGSPTSAGAPVRRTHPETVRTIASMPDSVEA